MNWLKNKHLYILIFFATVVIFFFPILQGKVPFPADALLGMYHPWRDVVWNGLTAGVPVKNPLITDPLRQQYPYRELAMSIVKKGELPLWNPYSFSGTPLLGNIQTALFYPMNILFFVFPFSTAWSFLIIFQPILSGVFLYFYLRFLNLDRRACILGAFAFSFSGFFIAWLTWGTVGHVFVWLPFVLLATERLIRKFSFRWIFTLIFAESSVVFAGHPQTAFYIIAFTTIYLIARIVQKERSNKGGWVFALKRFTLFVFGGFFVFIITSVQTVPSFKFIISSARNFDLPHWQRPDWFLPWQHLVQLVAPDFFGNPATGNYWGVWNYGEFVSYVGMIPLIMALFTLIFRKDKKTLFFGSTFFISLFFALPTPIAKIPYQLKLPFLSTIQPSRIIMLVDFSLAVLAGLGFDYFLKREKASLKSKSILIGLFSITFGILWMLILWGKYFKFSPNTIANLLITQRNLILPTMLFFISSLLFFAYVAFKKKDSLKTFIIISMFLFTVFDLLRFGIKFTPFVSKNWIYPSTQTIQFLQNNLGNHRFMTTDRRLFPPNVSTFYRLQDVSGYDPLYLKNYGELIAAWTRNSPDISPASFNRILTPERVDSFFPDLLGVKYIMSLTDLESEKLQLVFQEGETQVYENTHVFPRAFLAERLIQVSSRQEAIEKMFEIDDLQTVAIVNKEVNIQPASLEEYEFAEIVKYSENKITIKTSTRTRRVLVLTDIYYPTWHVFIDGKESDVFPVDYAFRGVVVPQGKHMVEFQARPL